MTGTEALKELRSARLRLEALAERRERCAALAKEVTPGRVRALERLQRELDQRAGEYAERVAEAERRIDAMGDALQRDVLRYRYLNGWSWREISARTGLSQDWLKHVHARAVKKICPATRKDTFLPG